MSVKDFHNFLTSDEQLESSGGKCVQTVDILGLHGGAGGNLGSAGSRLSKQYVQQRSALVVDGENCLDRLYGGYFSGRIVGECTHIRKKRHFICRSCFQIGVAVDNGVTCWTSWPRSLPRCNSPTSS